MSNPVTGIHSSHVFQVFVFYFLDQKRTQTVPKSFENDIKINGFHDEYSFAVKVHIHIIMYKSTIHHRSHW